jgi:hypothetical protein
MLSLASWQTASHTLRRLGLRLQEVAGIEASGPAWPLNIASAFVLRLLPSPWSAKWRKKLGNGQKRYDHASDFDHLAEGDGGQGGI